MAYYRGDYYLRGDYYKGDPFLGLGSLVGWAAKGISKLFKKKTVTAIATRLPALPARVATIARQLPGAVARQFPGTSIGLAAGKWWAGMTEAQVRARDPYGRADPDWLAAQQVPLIRPGQPGYALGPYTGRRRRMNVANPKALRRSLRRVAGFGKLASRARRDIGRAATAVGVSRGRGGPVARHHARIRRAA